MSNSLRLRFLSLLTILMLLTFVSCSSDDNPVSPDPAPDPTDVSGVVVKGPVSGAQVQIHVLAGDGSAGDLVAGPVTTAADGSWQATIPGGESGREFLVVATGGTYVDEISKTAADVPDGAEMFGFLDRDHPESVVVTPFTHMLHLQAREIVSQVGAATAWRRAIEKAEAENSFGFDPTRTAPSWDAGGDGDQKAYAALLGGVSAMAQEAGEYGALNSAPPFFLVMGAVEDLTDGTLDGMNVHGDPVEVPMDAAGTMTQPLPFVSADGIGLLNDWVQDYASGHSNLGDADLVEDMVVGVPTGEPEDFDCDDLADLKGAAYASLENTLFAVLNGPEPDRPADLDFSECRSLYAAILECDADDRDAHFALTVLDMVTLTLDAEVNDAFDAWRAYLDELVPFETDAPEEMFRVPTGISPEGALDLPFDAISRSMLPYLDLKRAVVTPELADVQAILRDVVLPRVVTGIDHMDAVLTDDEFTFSVSPRMQGDLLEEDRTADRTDFLALRAGLHALEAGIRIAVSYDVNLEDYTGDLLMAGLTQSTGQLGTLLSGGEAHMQQVAPALAAAANDLDEAIDSLIEETDAAGPGDQDDDLIKIGPRDIDRDEMLDFQALELQMMMDSLAGPSEYSYDWDGSDSTPDATMTVDFAGFFNDPVADFKALLPPYTLSKDVVPYEMDYNWNWDDRSAELTVPTGGYYNISCSVTYSNFVEVARNSDVPAWAQSTVDAFIAGAVAEFTADEDWTGSAQITIEHGGYLAPGTQNVNFWIQSQHVTVKAWVEVLTVTFAADNYADWMDQWPDPTLNGLFPNVQSAHEIADLFGWGDSGWTQEFSLDWAYDEFGFSSGDGPIDPLGS